MNYQKIYDYIIKNRIANSFNGYTERHHIIPKSMGGSDDLSNLVDLSAREHFICHWLLFKIHKNQAMACAWNIMCNENGNAVGERYTSHSFKYAREAHSKALSIANIGNTFSKGKKFSNEHKEKISKALTGKPKSEAHKQAMRKPKTNKGRINQSHRKKIKCLDTGDIYDSVKIASNVTGIHKDSISNCARGKTKTAGKCRWQYI